MVGWRPSRRNVQHETKQEHLMPLLREGQIARCSRYDVRSGPQGHPQIGLHRRLHNPGLIREKWPNNESRKPVPPHNGGPVFRQPLH